MVPLAPKWSNLVHLRFQGPKTGQKMPKLVKNGQKWVWTNGHFLKKKTSPLIWLTLAQNIIFGPIIMMKKGFGAYIHEKNFHGAKIEIFGPAHMPTRIKGATDQILP